MTADRWSSRRMTRIHKPIAPDPRDQPDSASCAARRRLSFRRMTSAATIANDTSATSAQFTRTFAIDLRSLAAMRILLGLATLWDLWARSARLTMFYTDAGVLPRSAVRDAASHLQSIYFTSGSTRTVAA